MGDDRSYAWPMLVIVAALLAAAIWKCAPVVASWIPPEAIASIRESANRYFGRTTDEPPSVSFVPEQTEEPLEEPFVPPPLLPKAVAAQTRLPSTNTAAAAESPYLKDAAKVYQEYRALLVDVNRGRNTMGLAEQREKMKKLHFLRERVEALNRLHREWKRKHGVR